MTSRLHQQHNTQQQQQQRNNRQREVSPTNHFAQPPPTPGNSPPQPQQHHGGGGGTTTTSPPLRHVSPLQRPAMFNYKQQYTQQQINAPKINTGGGLGGGGAVGHQYIYNQGTSTSTGARKKSTAAQMQAEHQYLTPVNANFRSYFDTKDELGRGTFGVTYLCRVKDNCHERLGLPVTAGQVVVKVAGVPSAQEDEEAITSDHYRKKPHSNQRQQQQPHRVNHAAVQKEVAAMRSVKSGHIVRYYFSWVEGDPNSSWYKKLCICMEFCNHTDLLQIMNRVKKEAPHEFFTPSAVIHIAAQLLHAVGSCHQQNLLHRDIKPANIFLSRSESFMMMDPPCSSEGGSKSHAILNANVDVKLGDFGMAKGLDSSSDLTSTFAGTPYYFPPEMLSGRDKKHLCPAKNAAPGYDGKYGLKADMWAIGVTLFELVCLKRPFSSRGLTCTNDRDMMIGIYQRILKHDPIPELYFTAGGRARDGGEPTTAAFPDDLLEVIRDLLQKDPMKRPSCREVLARDMFKASRHQLNLPSIRTPPPRSTSPILAHRDPATNHSPPTAHLHRNGTGGGGGSPVRFAQPPSSNPAPVPSVMGSPNHVSHHYKSPPRAQMLAAHPASPTGGAGSPAPIISPHYRNRAAAAAAAQADGNNNISPFVVTTVSRGSTAVQGGSPANAFTPLYTPGPTAAGGGTVSPHRRTEQASPPQPPPPPPTPQQRQVDVQVSVQTSHHQLPNDSPVVTKRLSNAAVPVRATAVVQINPAAAHHGGNHGSGAAGRKPPLGSGSGGNNNTACLPLPPPSAQQVQPDAARRYQPVPLQKVLSHLHSRMGQLDPVLDKNNLDLLGPGSWLMIEMYRSCIAMGYPPAAVGEEKTEAEEDDQPRPSTAYSGGFGVAQSNHQSQGMAALLRLVCPTLSESVAQQLTATLSVVTPDPTTHSNNNNSRARHPPARGIPADAYAESISTGSGGSTTTGNRSSGYGVSTGSASSGGTSLSATDGSMSHYDAHADSFNG